MARLESPPFARGETYYNGGTIDTTNLGGPNLEGKEFFFEVNAADDEVQADPSGRQIKVRVVRNVSGVNLKPARVVHFNSTTSVPYGTQVDGYCISNASVPAGVSDEFLPAAGVVNNDLFYIVVQGPTKVTNQTASPVTTAVGSRLVPAATGATLGDDLGGRVDLQTNVVAAASTNTGTNILNGVQNVIGFAGTVNNTTASQFECVATLRW
jgi:hypothetical protein